MIGQAPGRDDGHDDFTRLDALLQETMGGILAKLEAAFDPRERFARLAAGPARPAGEQARPRTGPSASSAALTAVCDQIDDLDHCLVQASRSAAEDPFPGAAFLDAARRPLRRLRAELAGRSATREQAEQILGLVQQHITHADTILKGALDRVLDQRIPGHVRSAGTLSTQLRALHTAIARLYDDAHDRSTLAPSR
ncbi:hypothetical protein Acsp04_60590 [Actinomadura sp. NBRC 104425]|uniref:hypothetical protein n=1 Tax=Actinomadura sp. NBRC 104425 TaxID=3032204 RepID=UPI0024A3DB02|nr:hypothetical protein [Actinomadura sp. NBRC 104425]GLZ15824.1 hypothetical protein Acsp04_60590 [Actinomadura sp. NBRC 104425]